MFRDLCGFFGTTGLHLSQVSHVILLAFMGFLLHNAITPSNIANYMAALRASFILYDLDTIPFQNQQLQYFLKAAKLQVHTYPKTKVILDEYLLIRIISACDTISFHSSTIVFASFLLFLENFKYFAPFHKSF